jgi:hypothetical protein
MAAIATVIAGVAASGRAAGVAARGGGAGGRWSANRNLDRRLVRNHHAVALLASDGFGHALAHDLPALYGPLLGLV